MTVPGVIHVPFSLAAGGIDAGEYTVLFLALAMLLGLARVLGDVARRFGQPSVLRDIRRRLRRLG